ncbi:hypothetical protein Pdw03_5650 [Penicillium digitatum]|uniref:Uncharacterized protein n=1 Tax=Penicillium digitatum TaxID=36651 RepID=A0A7T6XV85_PENDI|nr:hypothetical protein Pdw03_5650 [Penicillium digitatum]
MNLPLFLPCPFHTFCALNNFSICCLRLICSQPAFVYYSFLFPGCLNWSGGLRCSRLETPGNKQLPISGF